MSEPHLADGGSSGIGNALFSIEVDPAGTQLLIICSKTTFLMEQFPEEVTEISCTLMPSICLLVMFSTVADIVTNSPGQNPALLMLATRPSDLD